MSEVGNTYEIQRKNKDKLQRSFRTRGKILIGKLASLQRNFRDPSDQLQTNPTTELKLSFSPRADILVDQCSERFESDY